MSKSINKVQLLGYVGKDPEIKTTNNDKRMATFRLATNSYTNVPNSTTGQKQERTEWHNIVAWGRAVDIVEKFVRKGRQLHIDGRLQTRNYLDDTGKKRYFTEIVADEIIVLNKPQYNNDSENSENHYDEFENLEEVKILPDDAEEEDLPF